MAPEEYVIEITIGIDGTVAEFAPKVPGGHDVIFVVEGGKTAHLYFSPFNEDPIVIHGRRRLTIPPDAKKKHKERSFFYRVTLPGSVEFPPFSEPIPQEPGDPCIIVNGNGAVKGKGKKK